MKRFILLAISAILLASCEKEIEFNGEQTDPKLVVNSIVGTNEPVKAYISKSYFFLDYDENTGHEKKVLMQASLFPIIPSVSYSFKF
jgi:hypothetical protein